MKDKLKRKQELEKECAKLWHLVKTTEGIRQEMWKDELTKKLYDYRLAKLALRDAIVDVHNL